MNPVERKKQIRFHPNSIQKEWLGGEDSVGCAVAALGGAVALRGVGCGVAVVLETLYCFWRTGGIESRATFVWLPLNMVYGVAGVIMTMVLYRVRKYSLVMVFFVGMILGCVIEFLCSLVQEQVFQSVSWRYSGPTNLHGRTSLKYAVVWGLLALLWMEVLYPLLSVALLKIPQKTGRILTAVLLLILLINMAVTFIAVRRWVGRKVEAETSVQILQWVDVWFPDSRMEQLFPNLRFTRIGEPTS